MSFSRCLARCVCLLCFVCVLSGHADTVDKSFDRGPWYSKLIPTPDHDYREELVSGTKFAGMDMRGARFDQCDLSNVVFHQCDLRGASFAGAYLTGAVIRDCNVEQANFENAIVNGVLGPDPIKLDETQLKSTKSYRWKDLSHCLITGGTSAASQYDFENANLSHTVFQSGDFTRSDFREADLRNASFKSCKVSFAALMKNRYKRFRTVSFSEAVFVDRADFSGMNLSGASLGWFGEFDLENATVTSCTFVGNAVPKNQLVKTKNYKEGNLNGLRFHRVDLRDVDLSNQNLTGSSFVRSDLAEADLTNAVVTGAGFSSATGLTPTQLKQTWNHKCGHMESVRLPRTFSKSEIEVLNAGD